MDIIRTIELKKSILDDNDADADLLRQELISKGIFYVNLMSSPGSGKTSLLVKTIEALHGKCSIGVMEADIDSDVDACRINKVGAEAIQLHTGGMCHLDADMSRQGLKEFAAAADIVFLENVGNLVCPAEFDTGAFLNIMILSVPEGSDKPLKYPLMFEKADAVIINKIDAMTYFDFDIDDCRAAVARHNAAARIFELSAKTGEGIDAFADWIFGELQSWRKRYSL